MWGATAGVLGLFVPAGNATPPTCMGERATIVGTANADRIVGTPEADVITALAGADYVQGRGGEDLICGGAGDDHLTSGSRAGKLNGGDGDDTLVAGAGATEVMGEGGNDTILTAGGVGGRIYGGSGRDWLSFVDRDCGRGVTVNLFENLAAYAGCEDGSSPGEWTVVGIEWLEGSEVGDRFVGTAGRNYLMGHGGRDSLSGREGDDVLDGGTGHDGGRGGPGADRCLGVEDRVSCF